MQMCGWLRDDSFVVALKTPQRHFSVVFMSLRENFLRRSLESRFIQVLSMTARIHLIVMLCAKTRERAPPSDERHVRTLPRTTAWQNSSTDRIIASTRPTKARTDRPCNSSRAVSSLQSETARPLPICRNE